MQEVEQYLESQVMTSEPHRLHLMVIEGAVRFANRAVAALEEQDYEAAHFALNNSRGFVAELISGLDRKVDAEMVDRLTGLFVFAYERLMRADMDHDPQSVRDALRVLEMHQQTWLELCEQLREQPVNTTADQARSWSA